MIDEKLKPEAENSVAILNSKTGLQIELTSSTTPIPELVKWANVLKKEFFSNQSKKKDFYSP